MLDRKYVSKKICEIRQVLYHGTLDNVVHTDKLLDEIVNDVYDCGYEDGFSDCDTEADHDECHEPVYNEGMD